jgi:hypothetical protein
MSGTLISSLWSSASTDAQCASKRGTRYRFLPPLVTILFLEVYSLSTPGSKIGFTDKNCLQIQPPESATSASRTMNNETCRDLHNLVDSVKTAVDWFLSGTKTSERLLPCSDGAKQGLERLASTYAEEDNELVVHTLNMAALPIKIYNDKQLTGIDLWALSVDGSSDHTTLQRKLAVRDLYRNDALKNETAAIWNENGCSRLNDIITSITVARQLHAEKDPGLQNKLDSIMKDLRSINQKVMEASRKTEYTAQTPAPRPGGHSSDLPSRQPGKNE